MKRFFAKTFAGRSIALWWISLFFVAATRLASAAPLQEARVSQVIQDVRMLEAHAAPRPAVVNDKVTFERALRTGVRSRAELTFADLTITRLGANTIFSLKAGAREVDLTSGTILLSVPSGRAPVKANTTSVSVAVMGGTALLATGPPTKFMVLEGIGTIYPLGHPEKAATVHGGEMVIAENGRISNPEKFDVKLVLETSALIVDFPPLANLPLILAVMNQQLAEQQLLGTTSQSLARNLVDVIDVTDQNANANPILVAVRSTTPTPSITPPPTPTPSITPPPTPSKFGTPTTITSPNPYLITSGTVITTDPSITTNGVTDFGKIYRGSTDDGAFTLWAFGSTSAFDTALGIDNVFFADATHSPIAVFKFQNLSLVGNPMIDLSNGGVTKLALIGVDGITSGPPGGILTFTGLDLLVLATVNGSINLTSDVSFQDLSELAMYARGAGSDLILDSPISNIGILELAAEGSIQLTNPGTMSVGEFDATAGNNLTLQIGGSLLLNGKVSLNTLVLPGTTVASGVNLQLNTTGDFSNGSTGDFSTFQLTNQGTINQNGNLSLGVNGNLNCANGVLIQVNNELDSGVSATHGGTIGGDSSISVSASTVSTGGFLVSLLNENDQGGTGTAGGHIGGAASIAINVNGALTANANNPNVGVEPGAFDLFIENYGFGDGSPGGFIGSNASVSIAAASISTAADFAVGIDNFAGGTIGGAAQLSVTAGSMSVDEFFAGITNENFTGGAGSVGGQIAGAASITFNITGALNVAGGTDNDGDEPSTMLFQINNSGFGDGSPAGSIGSDASIDVTAGSISDNGRLLRLAIFNSGGGMIGGNASITLAADSISAAGPGPTGAGENLSLLIDNSVAGNIDGSATISLNVGSVSTAGSFNATINNSSGGSIGSDATITVTATNVSSAGSFNADIFNFSGGTIGGNATINVNATSISTVGDLSTFVGNNDHGSIGGNALLSFVLPGDINTQGAGNIEIFNDTNGTGGGTIGSDATITISAGNLSFGGALFTEIQNTAGVIGGRALLNFAGSGDISSVGDATFQIFNNDNGDGSGAGSIGSDATITVTATNVSSGGFLNTDIFNFSDGNIVGNANINFNLTGALTTQGDATFSIFNEDEGSGGGTIGSNATITVIASDLSSGGALNASIFNSTGGTIGGNANINFNLTGNLTTQGGASFNISNQSGIFGTTGGGVGGSIGSDAMINVTGGNLTADSLFVNINNRNEGRSGPGGMIDSSANLTFNLSGNLTTQTDATFFILNGFVGTIPVGGSGGTIGQDAFLNLTANSLSIGGALLTTIGNERNAGNAGGIISGSAAINLAISGGISALDDSQLITNSGGTIGSDATITVSAASLTVTDTAAGAFLALIDNSNGGVIGGNAAINMNVSGSATVTSDATFEILGSDGAAAAAININGGSYDAGGTFLAYIDGDGTITFNNASAHADVLKVGALGANGVLNIGGGMLSADTTLELYASGSNGQLNFVSNVTLGGNSIKILAANSITIFNNIVVTIGGSTPAEVYTNNANYTGFGGNGTTTGTFAGAGANNPLPLNQAPPFGPAPRRQRNGTINVSNTAELLALLDGAVVGPDGRIRIWDSKSASWRDLNRMNINRLSRLEHQLAIQRMRDRGITRVGAGRLAAAQ